MSPIGRARERVGAVTAVRGPLTGAPSSRTLPHTWHSPHRPTHFAVVHPHSLQAYPARVARVVRGSARRGVVVVTAGKPARPAPPAPHPPPAARHGRGPGTPRGPGGHDPAMDDARREPPAP